MIRLSIREVSKMEFVDGRLFLEKCRQLGCPIYNKFEDLARHEFKAEVEVECEEFQIKWLLNNIDWYSMGKEMAIECDTIKVVELDGQLYIMDIYEVYDEIIEYFKNNK